MRCAERENAGESRDSAAEFPRACPTEVTDPARLLACAEAGERTLPAVEHLVLHALGFDCPQLLRAARKALTVVANTRRADGLTPSPRVAALLVSVRAALAGKP